MCCSGSASGPRDGAWLAADRLLSQRSADFAVSQLCVTADNTGLGMGVGVTLNIAWVMCSSFAGAPASRRLRPDQEWKLVHLLHLSISCICGIFLLLKLIPIHAACAHVPALEHSCSQTQLYQVSCSSRANGGARQAQVMACGAGPIVRSCSQLQFFVCPVVDCRMTECAAHPVGRVGPFPTVGGMGSGTGTGASAEVWVDGDEDVDAVAMSRSQLQAMR